MLTMYFPILFYFQHRLIATLLTGGNDRRRVHGREWIAETERWTTHR